MNSVFEPSRETMVCRDVDVVVVGGGSGRASTVISATRARASTVLIERYGHVGGMATGGLVNIIPTLSDIYGRQHIAGLCQEIMDRMKARHAIHTPKNEEWGTGGCYRLSTVRFRISSKSNSTPKPGLVGRWTKPSLSISTVFLAQRSYGSPGSTFSKKSQFLMAPLT